MEKVIALVGNPNVGKSTVFNALTGLRQHTGNWPGKTVEVARGRYDYGGERWELVDLPGTYSLQPHSAEEEVTRDFLLSGEAQAAVVVCDATCLERNLNLVLQAIRLQPNTVLCVNLMDEARKKGIRVDTQRLSKELGIPVIPTAAGRGEGLQALKQAVAQAAQREQAVSLYRELPVEETVRRGETLARQVTTYERADYADRDRRLDRLVLGKWTGFPLLILGLMVLLWLTIKGANVPSALLSRLFGWGEGELRALLTALSAPAWLTGALVDGVYKVLSWVVAVMLPPMAIFFPLFTLLEDLGYLPRVAFLLDHPFQKARACGKQALTMCMGFGCNACGVTGCRIIDSPRERLIAILTNSFVPCNGRFAPPRKGQQNSFRWLTKMSIQSS